MANSEVTNRKDSILGMVLEGVVGAIAVAFSLLLTPLIRRWRMRWGASDDEVNQKLPGDEIVPNPKVGWTHAVTVHAPIASVWPWITQIGCRRAGWYSYDLLDNGGIPSADRILPEHQTLNVGDIIPMVPSGDFGIPVAEIQPGCTLVLGGPMPAAKEEPALVTWTVALNPQDATTTRLISRWRAAWPKSIRSDFMFGVMEAIGFVMDRKMLLNIRRRAEGGRKGAAWPVTP
jgi:hypothetical protein